MSVRMGRRCGGLESGSVGVGGGLGGGWQAWHPMQPAAEAAAARQPPHLFCPCALLMGRPTISTTGGSRSAASFQAGVRHRRGGLPADVCLACGSGRAAAVGRRRQARARAGSLQQKSTAQEHKQHAPRRSQRRCRARRSPLDRVSSASAASTVSSAWMGLRLREDRQVGDRGERGGATCMRAQVRAAAAVLAPWRHPPAKAPTC